MRRRTSRTAPRASANATAADIRAAAIDVDSGGTVSGGATVEARASKAGLARVNRGFADAMIAAGPFEPHPLLALAVSGGSDSMALALLSRDWVRRRKGRAIALIVDHGLRADAAAEARLVGRRLDALGLPHRILRWTGAKPASGIQAAARAARYALLAGWCRRNGALHLLTAHQCDDQAETVAMRIAHRSGEAGLAAMSLVAARDGVRLVRPLLALYRRELRAFVAAYGVAWVDDPSNEDDRFERIRVRRALKAADTKRMLRRAATAGAARETRDDAVADLLARMRPMPEGWLALPPELFADAALPVARDALRRCLLCIGGDEHAPRGERLDRLLAALREPGGFRGRTLGGCRIVGWRGSLLICREPAAIEPAVRIARGGPLRWDRRFELRFGDAGIAGYTIRPLGTLDTVAGPLRRARRAAGLPGAVSAGLPALCDRTGRPVAVPALGWHRSGRAAAMRARWQPRSALAPARFLSMGESCFNRMADYLE